MNINLRKSIKKENNNTTNNTDKKIETPELKYEYICINVNVSEV